MKDVHLHRTGHLRHFITFLGRRALVATVVVSGLAGLAHFAAAAVRTFTDNSGDSSFSNPQNWDGGTTIPTSGDSLILANDVGLSGFFGLDTGATFNTPSLVFAVNAPQWTVTAATQAQDVLNFTGSGTTTLQNLSPNQQKTTLVTFSLGGTLQTWDGGAGGLSISNIDLGNNQTLNITGTGTTAAHQNVITSAIVGTGTSGIVKQGTGNLLFASTDTNTYLGSTKISGGTLQLGKNNQISSNAAGLIMDGGTFNLAGFNQAFTTAAGTLSLTNNSFIDFGVGSNAAKLTLADSSALNWNSFTLTILDYNVGDVLQFGSSSTALTSAQLADIHFGVGGPRAQIDASGIVTPIPEPSAALLLGCGLLSCLARRRKAPPVNV